MQRLEFENHLIQELMERGATSAEAQRLAALAQAMSRTKVHIDPNFANSVEALLLRDRPDEALAKIISITRTLDSDVYRELQGAKLSLVPDAEPSRRRNRMNIRIAVAAAVALFAVAVVFAVAGLAQMVVNGTPGPRKTRLEVERAPVPGVSQILAMPGSELTSRRALSHSTISSRPTGQPTAPTDHRDPPPPPPPVPRCRVSGQASPGPGFNPVSVSCASAKSTATAPLS